MERGFTNIGINSRKQNTIYNIAFVDDYSLLGKSG